MDYILFWSLHFHISRFYCGVHTVDFQLPISKHPIIEILRVCRSVYEIMCKCTNSTMIYQSFPNYNQDGFAQLIIDW